MTTNKVSTASPLKTAASLIQTLEMAQTEMTGFAADAARDSESARRNARAAQEIARRYQNRSYPRVKSSFEDITVSALSSKSSKMKMSVDMAMAGNSSDSNRRPIDTSITSSTASAVTPRPKPPTMKTLHSHQRQQTYQTEDGQLAGLKTPQVVSAAATSENGHKDLSRRNDEVPVSTSHSNDCDRKSNGFHTQSSVERIAQQHAEDVLKLTLELERTKQSLKSEQRQHRDCKSAVGSLQLKANNLEKKNQSLLEALEKERSQSTQKLSSLEQELESSRVRVEAAEEDAQLALDLAKDASERKDYLEDELFNAVEEIRQLKETNELPITMNGTRSSPGGAETPKRH
ncbi:MAG: hypothetical protein SGILL_009801, partial [Bacillariaceae sp.]